MVLTDPKEIQIQGKSSGILYQGYEKAFRECVFEEGGVEGRNERYEFRCDVGVECCGRTCCTPEDAVIPLWLIILFVILSLMLLACILGTLAYLCAKRRKPKPKKDFSDTKYTTLVSDQNSRDGANRDARQLQRYLEQDPYSTPDNLYGGYGNRTYSHSGGSRDRYATRDAARDAVRDVRDMTRYDPRARYGLYDDRRVSVSSDGGSIVRHGVHETVEESFKQEITYERPASTDSREML